MKNYVQFGKLRQGASETACFVEGINDLFDVLNSAMKHGQYLPISSHFFTNYLHT